MPKLKLRGSQFMLMHEALTEKYERESLALYELLLQHSDKAFENTLTAIDDAKAKVLEKHKELISYYKTVISAIEVKKTDNPSNFDSAELEHFNSQLQYSTDLLHKIYDMCERIYQFRNIASIIKDKSTDKDFFRTYDDDTSWEPPEIDDDEWDRRTDAWVY